MIDNGLPAFPLPTIPRSDCNGHASAAALSRAGNHRSQAGDLYLRSSSSAPDGQHCTAAQLDQHDEHPQAFVSAGLHNHHSSAHGASAWLPHPRPLAELSSTGYALQREASLPTSEPMPSQQSLSMELLLQQQRDWLQQQYAAWQMSAQDQHFAQNEPDGPTHIPASLQQLPEEASAMHQPVLPQHSQVAWGAQPRSNVQRPSLQLSQAYAMHGLTSLGTIVPSEIPSTHQTSYAASQQALLPAHPAQNAVFALHARQHQSLDARIMGQSRPHPSNVSVVGTYAQQLQLSSFPAQPLQPTAAVYSSTRPAGLPAEVGDQSHMQQYPLSLLHQQQQQQSMHGALQQRLVAAQIARGLAGPGQPNLLIIELVSRCACMLDLQQLDTVKLTLHLYSRIRSEVCPLVN